MKKIDELFAYMQETTDDEIRHQLIEFMKTYFKTTSWSLGTANPVNRYKLRLRRLINDTRNLADVINYCFENDISMVIKELNTSQPQPIPEMNLYSFQTLSKKLDLSPNTIRTLMKSGELKYVRIQATGSKRRLKRFTPEAVDEYLKKHTR